MHNYILSHKDSAAYNNHISGGMCFKELDSATYSNRIIGGIENTKTALSHIYKNLLDHLNIFLIENGNDYYLY